jgi:hypothetical protein
MQPSIPSEDFSNLLCSKGLLQVDSLSNWMAGAMGGQGGLGFLPAAEREVVKRDEITLRHAFASRFSAVELVDAGARLAELERRASMVALLFRAYRAGHRAVPLELRRELQAAEVEMFLSAVSRLVLTTGVPLLAMAEYLEVGAAADDDLVAHVFDPLQLRYVLACHDAVVRDQLGEERIRVLKAACTALDRTCLRAWFDDVVPYLDVLSKDAPQFLRGILHDVCRSGGGGDLAGLAYEIAALDVRMFGEPGWESSRTFCALLRLTTAPGSEVLDAYLTDEEIDTALLAAEAVRQDELIAHFRRLATSYNTRRHRTLHRSVAQRARRQEAGVETAAMNTEQTWSVAAGAEAQTG